MTKTGFAIITVALFSLVTVVIPTPALAFVTSLSGANFDSVVNGNHLVLVEFMNPDCPHCQKMVGPFQELSTNYGYTVIFATLNIVDYPSISQDYQIQSTPTFILFEDGYPIRHVEGDDVGALEDLLLSTNNGQTQTGPWTLTVNVNNIPSDVSNVIATVKGPYGVVRDSPQSFSRVSSVSNTLSTTFDIGTDEIPDGYNYQVCVREGGSTIDWCWTFIYNGGTAIYAMVDWPDASAPAPSPSNGCGVPSPSALLTDGFNIVPIQLDPTTPPLDPTTSPCSGIAPPPDLLSPSF